MLIEVAAKAVSAILNTRMQELLKVVGRESQNGFTVGRGCPDSSFSLRCALQVLREHGETTWVAFIDLVKAFDSVDREAMCAILLKYGAPETLVSVVRAMHNDVRVKMVAGEDAIEFTSSLGVLQGAAASPVLFLFVIAAWFETMDWPDRAIAFRSSDGHGKPVSEVFGDKEMRGQGESLHRMPTRWPAWVRSRLASRITIVPRPKSSTLVSNWYSVRYQAKMPKSVSPSWRGSSTAVTTNESIAV